MATELRSTVLTKAIPRTGTLTVDHIIDLAALRETHGDSIPVDALADAGHHDVTHEIAGKSKRLAHGYTADESAAFVMGFLACAAARKRREKKAVKA